MYNPRSLEYFLLQNRNHTDLHAPRRRVIDVYMHSKDNPSCIATLCMRKGADMHNRDDFFMHQMPHKLMKTKLRKQIRSAYKYIGNLKLFFHVI